MKETASQIGDLSHEKLGKLLDLVKNRKKPEAEKRVIQRQNLPAAPLSYSQERLWFLDQMNPGLALFNMPFAFQVKGNLNFFRLRDALSEIIRRHESLRTIFEVRGEEPAQIVTPAELITLSFSDLSNLSEEKRNEYAKRLASLDSQRPTPLAKGPMFRVYLLKLAKDEHVLLMNMHHIVSDGWSLKVFFDELGRFYDTYKNGLHSQIPELEIQYGDYAQWQRQWLQGDALEQRMSYWKRQLSDAPEFLDLPTDRPRPKQQSYNGKVTSFNLSKLLSDKLVAQSRETGTTLYMTLLAAFQVLLYRFSGQDDICIGSPVAGRKPGQTEPMIGFFLNTLVMRTKLSGNPSFLELLNRTKETCLGAYANQDMPFDKIVGLLRPVRSPAYSPLFQVWFVLQNIPGAGRETSDLSIRGMHFDYKFTQFDLVMSLSHGPQAINGQILYNTDLFDATTIAELIKHFASLLRQITSDPSKRILEIPLGSVTESTSSEISPEFIHSAKPEEEFAF